MADAAKPLTRAEVRALVEHWRSILVPEWHVEVRFEFVPEPYDDISADDLERCNAIVWRPHRYHRTHMYVGATFQTRGAIEAEQTVVHELLHLAMRDFNEAAHTRTPMRKQAEWVFREQLTDAEEDVVDRIAWVIVGNHPSGLPLRLRSRSVAKRAAPRPRRRKTA